MHVDKKMYESQIRDFLNYENKLCELRHVIVYIY